MRSGAWFFAAAFVATGVFGASPALAQSCPGHPDAIGTSRVLTVGPETYLRVGRMQYPMTLPLADKEVVLTFDDGPLSPYSNHVLDILASQCVKATFFVVGKMAKAFPALVRREYEAGHSIGSHSADHPTHFDRLSGEPLAHEIDDGIASVSAALGDPAEVAPFFRIPGLARSEAVEEALAARGLVVFSVDAVADDWYHRIRPAQIIQRAMTRLEKHGRGILLLHDIHPATAAALPGLLKQLKEHGFHIVHVVPPTPSAVATAAARKTQVLASAAGEPLIAEDASARAWPLPPQNITGETAVLPVPDENAFAAGIVGFNESAGENRLRTGEWPELARAALPSHSAELPAPEIADFGVNMKRQKLVGPKLGLRPTLTVSPAKARAHPAGFHNVLGHTPRRTRLAPVNRQHAAAPASAYSLAGPRTFVR